MSVVEINASFGAPVQDRATLSNAARRTLEALYRHPIAHNLDRQDVLSLFTTIGSVKLGSNHDVTFCVGDERLHVTKVHGKDVAVQEIMDLRRMLTRAGWGEGTPDAALGAAPAMSGDMLVVVEADEARLFQLDLRAADQAAHIIRPNDPHRIRRHLAHHDQGRDEQKREHEEAVFFEAIAKALVSDGEIVLVGHGEGHSNVGKLLSEYLHNHHPLMFKRVVNAVVADIPQMTDPQLLELARTSLTS